MSRMDDLMAAAAQRFDDGGSPFEHEWLSQHSVTLEECYTLSEQIALAIKVSRSLRATEVDALNADRIFDGVETDEAAGPCGNSNDAL